MPTAGESPKASKHAHRQAMSNAHHISAPTMPRLPRRSRRRASRTPSPTGESQRRSLDSPGRHELGGGDQRDHRAAEDRGDDRHRERATAGDDAGVEPEAAEQQRAHVDRVQEDHERRHAGGDVTRLHAGLLQRPGRQRDAAGAGAGEQARGSVARERDLRRRAQPDTRAPAFDRDGTEQDRVADEGQRFEHEGEGEPSEVAVGELAPDVGEIGQGGGDDDEAGDHHRTGDDEHDHLPRGHAADGQRAAAWSTTAIASMVARGTRSSSRATPTRLRCG